MTLYVDGIRVLAGDGGRRVDHGIDVLVNPAAIAAVEVYSGATSLPAEYAGVTGRCGVVALWTG